MNILKQYYIAGVKLAVAECATPGKKIRSKGQGRGQACGEGKGPIGVPIEEKPALPAIKEAGIPPELISALIGGKEATLLKTSIMGPGYGRGYSRGYSGWGAGAQRPNVMETIAGPGGLEGMGSFGKMLRNMGKGL